MAATSLASLLATNAHATPTLAHGPDTPEVYNGTPAEACAWPTVVAVTSGGGLCTGTLIHPELVVYAAHCGGGQKLLRFSTTSSSGGFSVLGDCTTNPSYNSVGNVGEDWAFCRLAQAVNIPITPAMHGCEMDLLLR